MPKGKKKLQAAAALGATPSSTTGATVTVTFTQLGTLGNGGDVSPSTLFTLKGYIH